MYVGSMRDWPMRVFIVLPLGGTLGGFIYAASSGLQVALAFYSKSKCWALRALCILRAGFFLGRNQIGQYRGLRGHTLVSWLVTRSKRWSRSRRCCRLGIRLLLLLEHLILELLSGFCPDRRSREQQNIGLSNLAGTKLCVIASWSH
jgi:hypothetical protein